MFLPLVLGRQRLPVQFLLEVQANQEAPKHVMKAVLEEI